MAKRGAPRKVNIETLIADVDDYIAKANPPIVAEYAHLHNITRCYLYQLAEKNEELSNAIKKIAEAKEVMLEQKALSGKYNSSMAIFSLKQLGWKDSKDTNDANDDDMVKQFIDALKGAKE